jgi:trk system potassium uptake protein TrkA
VIDLVASAFEHLPLDFRGRRIEGDALTRNVLERAGVERSDGLVAITNSDTLNVLLAHIAKTVYHVPTVVAGNYDPRQRPLQEAFGIPVVGSASWGAQRIEELLCESPLCAVPSDGNSHSSVYQYRVPEIWQERTLQELLPEDVGKAFAVTRDGRPVPLSGALLLQTHDLIYLSVEPGELAALKSRLGFPRERVG